MVVFTKQVFKHDTVILQLDPKEQLKNISSIKVYNYGFDNQYADMVGMTPSEMHDTGVIAQEVREVLPDAVKETGDLKLPNGCIENLQVVNKVCWFSVSILGWFWYRSFSLIVC